MTQARALHIGLNRLNPTAYEGWDGQLNACIQDANDMARISAAQGLSPTVLTDRWATRATVLTLIRRSAQALRSGDLYVLSYSGHGGQVQDFTGEESDGFDETWCLYDGELIDDELYQALHRFVAGVRVLVLSDSCHSGTMVRLNVRPVTIAAGVRSRMMPRAVAAVVHAAHRDEYRERQEAVRASGQTADSVQASVVLISGCLDNQTSLDGEVNGAFTEQVLRVWNHGRYNDSTKRFHALVRAGLPSTQSPNLMQLGPDIGLFSQRPFTK